MPICGGGYENLFNEYRASSLHLYEAGGGNERFFFAKETMSKVKTSPRSQLKGLNSESRLKLTNYARVL